MNTDTQSSLLQRSLAARSSANWSLLIQCLQQLILGETAIPPSQDTPPGSESEVQPLLEMAEGKKASRTKTSAPLVESDKEAVLSLAMDVLQAGDFHERWDIAKVFPRLGAIAISPLIEILEDEDADEELHWYAVRLLGEFNSADAIAALVEVLKTSHNQANSLQTEENYREELSAQAAAALGQIGTPAVAALTELLDAEETRLLAVRSLAYIRRSETIAPLLMVVKDPQIAVRIAAIEALSSFHDPRVPPVLLNALNDVAASVRREAVVGLGFRSDLREELDLVNQLIPRLYDSNMDVCAATAIALSRLGTHTAAAALFEVLRPNTPLKLQLEIIRALGWVGIASGLEYLQQALNQFESPAVWQEIVAVLGRAEPHLKAVATEILIQMLKSHHPGLQHESVKSAIALSLGQLGEMQALSELIGLLADPDTAVRLHAIAALKQLDSAAAHEQLQQMATNDEIAPQLKQGVAIALSEWSIQ